MPPRRAERGSLDGHRPVVVPFPGPAVSQQTRSRLIATTNPSGAGPQTELHVCVTNSWSEPGARAPGV
jgi:hypothetical protein